MKLYRNLKSGLPTGVEDDEAWREETLGGRFVTLCAERGWTLDANAERMVEAFHDLLGDYWTWNPRGKKSSETDAAALLDGERRSEECALASRAMQLVLTFGKPYGLGIGGHRVGLVTYNGAETVLIGVPENEFEEGARSNKNPNMGFVSTHPTLGLFGLTPNVTHPGNGRAVPLYSWKDHKVVKVDGRFWDVCYNDIYDLPSQMSAAPIIRESYRRGGMMDPVVTETKHLLKKSLQVFYTRNTSAFVEGQYDSTGEVGPYSESVYGDVATDGELPPLENW